VTAPDRPVSARDRLIVALDVPTAREAEAMFKRLGGNVGIYKIGLELIMTRDGVALAERLVGEGHGVFLDAKLLDIDATVGRAVENAARLGIRFLTGHGYPQAMRAAAAARGDSGLKLLGVTVLTSMAESDFATAGYSGKIGDRVRARAKDAVSAGLDGVIASPAEAAEIRRTVGKNLLIVTPGIRPAGAEMGDQRRAATPAAAISAGADYLVVGRPITAAADPSAAAKAIVDEIATALADNPHG
jgi:orotidine-5'-phosphate decarboxylase